MEQETSRNKQTKNQQVKIEKTRFQPPIKDDDKDPGAKIWYMGF